jgi:NADH dehydrogenase
MFDSALAEYAANLFARQGIHVHTRRTVTRVDDGTLHLKEEGEVKFGMLVWSTGLDMTPLIKEMKDVRKDPKAGRIVTDEYLRLLEPGTDGEKVEVIPDVYAIGDCSVIEGNELPATAQVASQKATWLRKRLNLLAKKGLLKSPSQTQPLSPHDTTDTEITNTETDIERSAGRGFRYHNIVTLAYLGSWNAIAQRSQGHGLRG